MKVLNKIALFFTGSFAAFTAICGFYIANAPVVEASSLNFHMGLGALTILCSFGTIALFARQTKPNVA
ncbi:MAG: hypothetical protein M1490_02915 [Candidatus Bathyarchaeota archaeon]|nr:hypothetical protein [Candidatus Bathyarchaeota archaeon]